MNHDRVFLKKGKVKEVYEAGKGTLEFVFTDQISVFDKIIPSCIPHKGECLCRTSEFWFRRAAERFGIKTHFIARSGANRMLVKKVDVIREYNRINTSTQNYLIPLEFICRHYVSGSLHDRLKSGALDYKQLGLNAMPKYGEKLPQPFFELTTKLEEIDSPLKEDEALQISGLTKKELNEIEEAIYAIDEDIAKTVSARGLIHVDGKKEFAFDHERALMVIDTYGTADEDRFWDAAEYEKGNCIELSKEYVRQHYRKTGYHQHLMDARNSGQSEPDIPPLPDDVVSSVSRLYIDLFERMTGERFR